MSDVRLVGTNPEDGSLVPVSVTAAGLLRTAIGKIEKIPNDVEIDGNLTVTGTINGDTSGGGGLPDPLGNNGDVLTVVNGAAAWATPLSLPPDPFDNALLGWANGGLVWFEGPPPPPTVTIKTQPFTGADASPQFRDVNGNAVDPANGWDQAARELPAWDSATFTQEAQGVSVKGSHNLTGTFDLANATGMVLTINLAAAWDMSASGYAASVFTCDNSNVVPLFEDGGNYGSSGSTNRKLWTYQFLCNRPEIIGATFTFGLSGDYTEVASNSFAQFQSWSLDDPGEAALKRQISFEQQMRAFQARVEP